jgi:hypothetical protein
MESLNRLPIRTQCANWKEEVLDEAQRVGAQSILPLLESIEDAALLVVPSRVASTSFYAALLSTQQQSSRGILY